MLTITLASIVIIVVRRPEKQLRTKILDITKKIYLRHPYFYFDFFNEAITTAKKGMKSKDSIVRSASLELFRALVEVKGQAYYE